MSSPIQGTVCILVWGCPPFALVDGPLRAAKAAVDLFGSLTSILEGAACRHVLAMGLTTGRAFAGNVGSAARCEYSVLGTCVSMAARLMGVAYKQGGGIVSDHATCKFVRNGWSGVELGPMREVVVKGSAKPMKVANLLPPKTAAAALLSPHRDPPSPSGDAAAPLERSDRRLGSAACLPASEETFVGRDAELAALVANVRAFVAGRGTQLALDYSAQYGMGKSALLRAGAAWLTREVPDAGICWVFGDDFMRCTPFFAFRMPWMMQLVHAGISQARGAGGSTACPPASSPHLVGYYP